MKKTPDPDRIRYGGLILLIFLWICCHCHTVFACRYNVRETGFVDIGDKPYCFYGYINDNTPEEIIFRFNQILHAHLIDCNIRAEIINADQQNDHPSMVYLHQWQIQSFPAAVLVSPDGQSLVVTIEKKDEPFEKTLRSAIDDMVTSAKREEIIQKTIETYGVILLIEGANARENKQFHNAASQAVELIKRQMKFMPKHILHPPALISLEPASFEEEKILLWSLGLNADDLDKPHAAVFYGKARWIGPLMKGGEITENNLIGILSIVGADCECGLDISWVQGTMLPIRWDQRTQAEVFQSLEFDPENPMVKMEISRILNKGYSSYPGVPSGYQDVPGNAESFSTSYIVDEEKTHIRVLKYSFAGFIILILVTSFIIFIRAKRRTN